MARYDFFEGKFSKLAHYCRHCARINIFISQRVATEGLKFRRVDAQGQVVGRLASQIAQVLMGKDKPTYSPNKDDGDVVVVVNASKVEFTGNKWRDKLYRWHTGYPGGLKERSAQDQMARKPDDIIRRAVLGMLPKNKLRRAMNRKLIIAAGESHPLENHPQLENFTLPKRRIRPEPAIELSPGFKPFNPEAFSKRLQRRH